MANATGPKVEGISNREQPHQTWWTTPEYSTTARQLARLGCWQWVLATDALTWSDEMYEIYAIAPDAFPGTYKAFLALVHPDDRAHVTTAVATAIETQQSFAIYHRLGPHYQEARVIHAHGQPMHNEKGKTVGLFGTVQDVTSMKASESEVTQQAQQLAMLTNLGQTITATVDLPTIYKQVVAQVAMLTSADHALLFLANGDELALVACSDQKLLTSSHEITMADLAAQITEDPQPLWQYGDKVGEHLPDSLTEAIGYRPLAILLAPVLIHEELIGFIMALAADAAAFSNEGLQLVEGAANWSAIAIANRRKQEAYQEQLREMETIIAVSRLISETVGLQRILQVVVESAKEMVCEADWSVIHIYHKQRETLDAVSASGLTISLQNYSINIEEGVAGAVFQRGELINVADLLEDERALPFDLDLKSRSLLVVPLKNRDTLIGTISVQCYKPDTFSASDERLLTALGLQACIAIQNAGVISDLEDKQQQLQQLSRQIVTMQEDERRRIAQDLHDEAGQLLTALRISLGLLRDDLPIVPSTPETVWQKERIDSAINLTDDVMQIVRTITYDLRPPSLTTAGLRVALEGLCQNFAQQAGIALQYQSDELPALTDNQSIMLYRIVQEALTNVARHADAKHVQVTVSYDKNLLRLRIADDGRGFDPKSRQPSYFPTTGSFPIANEVDAPSATPITSGTGLLGVAERCELLNAHLAINSTIGKGTEIMITLPLETIS